MSKNTLGSSHEATIRNLIEKWADATRQDQKDQILANHASDATIFDVLPPLKYEGTDAYRKSWDEWQPVTEGPALFEIHDLEIVTGEGIAFAYGLIRCGGSKPDGTSFEDWVRATFCLRRSNGQWLVAHQHISMPVL
ncbi:MAG: nuclear transport factor 2 family protein [Cyanobacteria bacterium J06623_5]